MMITISMMMTTMIMMNDMIMMTMMNIFIYGDANDDDEDDLDGGLGAGLVVEADETKAFALVCSSVNEHLVKIMMILMIMIMMVINMVLIMIMMIIMTLMTLTNTLELMTFPNGKNICMSSASPNSCEKMKRVQICKTRRTKKVKHMSSVKITCGR